MGIWETWECSRLRTAFRKEEKRSDDSHVSHLPILDSRFGRSGVLFCQPFEHEIHPRVLLPSSMTCRCAVVQECDSASRWIRRGPCSCALEISPDEDTTIPRPFPEIFRLHPIRLTRMNHEMKQEFGIIEEPGSRSVLVVGDGIVEIGDTEASRNASRAEDNIA